VRWLAIEFRQLRRLAALTIHLRLDLRRNFSCDSRLLLTSASGNGGYLQRLTPRVKKPDTDKWPGLALPCGAKAKPITSPGGIMTYGTTGVCFRCNTYNKCSFKAACSISSYAIDLLGDSILELQHLEDPTHRASLVEDTFNFLLLADQEVRQIYSRKVGQSQV
jgi:hypothetical protein